MERIRVGIIGYGMMGRMQAVGCLGELRDTYELVAVCDDYGPNLAEAHKTFGGKGVKFFDNYLKMLDGCEFDLAVIVTPDFLHEEMAIACLEHGRHVRLEKPMAIDPGGCERIIAAAKKAGTQIQIGLELRYAEHIVRMRKAAENLGVLKMEWCHEFRNPFLEKKGSIPDWIVHKKYSGGTLIEKCCHHFDLFNSFAGAKPELVYASGDHEIEYGHTDVLDNAFVTVEYGNSVRAMLSLCMFAPKKANQKNLMTLEFGLIGSTGRVEMREDDLYVWDRKTGGEESFHHDRNDRIGHNDEITPSYLDLAHCIRNGGRPLADLRAGLNSVLVAYAAEMSASERRPVRIEEVERLFETKYMVEYPGASSPADR